MLVYAFKGLVLLFMLIRGIWHGNAWSLAEGVEKQENRNLQVVLLTEVSEQRGRLVILAVRIFLTAAMNLTSARKLYQKYVRGQLECKG
ncbi:unnamed protein product [Pieris brassicae]|uniref:Uncharacterized protein n=1 Tax=Pieris brassicae TaxID=7116 RepID=A0A9P0TVF3_PIEBR|nr:unnamed protein product [Pieris brassicae]